jgi:hypothetical protein
LDSRNEPFAPDRLGYAFHTARPLIDDEPAELSERDRFDILGDRVDMPVVKMMFGAGLDDGPRPGG